jgi:hypothetical protein
VSTPKGTIPIRAKDPTAAQIARRATEIRAQWSDDVEEKRRVEQVAPIVHWPIDDSWLPTDSWEGVPI